MSFKHQGRIVTDGLIFCLDAANTKSYANGNIAWRDLSLSHKDVSLIASPTFNDNNLGSINFNGTTQYATISSFSQDNSYGLSVFMWIYPTDFSTGEFEGEYYNWLINKRPEQSTDRDWQLVLRQAKLYADIWITNDAGITTYPSSTYTILPNAWQYVGMTTTGITNGPFTTYYNANINSQTTMTGNRKISNIRMDIGTNGFGYYFWYEGNISNISIYNKCLSDVEIKQNYNALKGRYGL